MTRLRMPDFAMRTLAHQLGGPSGPLGSVVARLLDKSNGPRITAAVEALELTGSESVADIGFGGGMGLDLLLGRTHDGDGRVHGVEPSHSMLARARRHHLEAIASGRLRLHEARLERLPFVDGALDGWISLNTLYFCDELEPVLGELARVLVPGGCGVVGIGDPAMMQEMSVTRHGFRIRPVREVVTGLQRAGLTVDHRRHGGDKQAYHLLVCRPAG